MPTTLYKTETPREGEATLLNDQERNVIYFESGEADGPEPTYTDRIYISTDFRDSGHRTTGPGSSCEGQCGGNAGGADATLYEYHAVPAPEDQYWVIWLR